MRIIDKNIDFYDYCQYLDKTGDIVFDRRDSYNLTKQEFASLFYLHYYPDYIAKTNFVLLQAGSTFWLFVLYVKNHDNFKKCTDYDVDLINTWKDYDKPQKLLNISIIEFKYPIVSREDFIDSELIKTDVLKTRLRNAIHTNDLRSNKDINKFTQWIGDKRIIKTIPLLKSIGIQELINPQELYLAIEEYLSMQKTSAERSESINITDTEKIINHGFDDKKSFRGKNK